MIRSTEIILREEPTVNMETETTDKVYSLLKGINMGCKTTFISVTYEKKTAEIGDISIKLRNVEEN